LCDESVPLAVEHALITDGHDVDTVRTLMPVATTGKFLMPPCETSGFS